MSGMTALVTGAANGLGAAIVDALAAARHRLILLDKDADVTARAAALRDAGHDAQAIHADLAETDAIPALIAGLRDRMGPVHILVNNAGIGIPGSGGGAAALGEVGIESWERVIAVNLTAPFLLCQALVPGMVAHGWGRVVNMSSRAGRTAVAASDAAYASTKAGIIGLTRRLALEVAEHGVTVNAIAPGRFDTALANHSSAPDSKAVIDAIPVRRVGRPAEVAAAVRYLASNDAGFITGAVLDINGGTFIG